MLASCIQQKRMNQNRAPKGIPAESERGENALAHGSLGLRHRLGLGRIIDLRICGAYATLLGPRSGLAAADYGVETGRGSRFDAATIAGVTLQIVRD